MDFDIEAKKKKKCEWKRGPRNDSSMLILFPPHSFAWPSSIATSCKKKVHAVLVFRSRAPDVKFVIIYHAPGHLFRRPIDEKKVHLVVSFFSQSLLREIQSGKSSRRLTQ